MLKIALPLSVVMALAGCAQLSSLNPLNLVRRGDPDQFAGHLIGPPVGIRSAEELTAEGGWAFVAPTTGVAAGSLVARRDATAECAYAQADGLFRVTRCP